LPALAGVGGGDVVHRIDEAAKHAFERLGGAKVREFVPILAWRHAREHLRRAS
jgi:hypothetical protein